MNKQTRTTWWKTPYGIVLCGFLAVAAFFLIAEHTAHVLGVLPYLLLAACPLMHLFMHHGHGGHGTSDNRATRSAEGAATTSHQH